MWKKLTLSSLVPTGSGAADIRFEGRPDEEFGPTSKPVLIAPLPAATAVKSTSPGNPARAGLV